MKVFLLLIILIISDGCITKRGTKVDIPSSGREITPSDLVRQPNGTYKIKPKERTKIPDGIPYDSPSSNVKVTSLPVPAKPVISRPKPVEGNSVEAEEVLPTVKASGKITPFSPTVTDASNIKVNVTHIPNENQTTAGEANVKTEEEEEMQVKWPELMLFYLCCAAVILIGYMCYKTVQNIRSRKATKKTTKPKKSAARRTPRKRLTKKKKGV